MSPSIRLQPIRVLTENADNEGCLVMADEQLAAVLVRLDGAEHGDHHGRWFLEAGFGKCSSASPPIFADPDEGADWVVRRINGRDRS
jgi:hypothetical protein